MSLIGTIVIIIAYIIVWALTSALLLRGEKNELLKAVWVMVGIVWPVVWLLELILRIKEWRSGDKV